MTYWVWIESGECVDAPSHEEGVALLRSSNRSCNVRAEDVLDEEAAHQWLRSRLPMPTDELVRLLAPRV
jgi:hypothetical protein